jgi:hypothetical protein
VALIGLKAGPEPFVESQGQILESGTGLHMMSRACLPRT